MNSYKISRVPVVGGGKRERRTPFSQRVDELADNLKGFFAYNPGYEQEGPMQIAVSARVDEGTYQYAPDKYAENILVSKTPRKGDDFFVAGLGASRLPGGRNVGKRCHYSRTYYVWKNGEDYCCRLLLNNGEQLVAKKADAALDWIIARVGGTALQDGSGWFRFRLEDGLNSLGRIRCYWDKDEELRVLICMPNSGAILDYASFDVEIGEVLQPGHYYSTRFLNFMLNGLDNLQSNQTLSQKELNDDLTP